MNDDLQRAFEETHFIVHHRPQFTLRIGQTSPELDELLQATGQDSAAFITAWNPMCQMLELHVNRQRQKSLKDELDVQSLTTIPGIGQHPTNGWPGEESLLVLGLQLETARALAHKHEQLAFVWTPRNGVSALETMCKFIPQTAGQD